MITCFNLRIHMRVTNPFFSLKLVDVSFFTKGHHQNYCEIRKQHHIIKFKN